MKTTVSIRAAGVLFFAFLLAYLGVRALAPCLFLLPALLAYPILRGQRGLALFTFAAAVLGVLAASAQEAGYMLAAFLPAALLLALFFRRGLPYRSALSALALCFALARYAMLCLPSLLAGEEAYAAVRAQIALVMEAYVQMGSLVGLAPSAALAALMEEMAPEITMVVVIAPALLFALLNVLLLRFACVRTGIELRPMAPYYEWRLSKESLTGALILLGGALIVRFFSLKNAAAVSTAIETLLLCQFALNGFCYMDFMALQVLRQPPWRRAMRYVLYGLFFMYGATVIYLAVMGLLDCLLSLRARYARGRPQGPES